MFIKTFFLTFILFLNFVFARWHPLCKGMAIGQFTAQPKSDIGDSKITILKVDPHWFQLKLFSTSQLKHKALTAEQWAKKYGLIAVTNAGMFDTDFRTHVGYMKNFNHLNNPVQNHYQSVAAFNPIDSSRAPFMIFDLDRVSFDQILKQYQCLIQNLRLIRRPGENRWKQKINKWSEAALGQDREGNILFIFCRSPYSMHDLNNILLKLPIRLVAAQHLEGGPEASFYFKFENMELRLTGSYETNFNENDHNSAFWPIPNVLGVVKK